MGDIAKIERALMWTRAAQDFMASIVGLIFAGIALLQMHAGNMDGAALWFIAALLTRLAERRQ